MSLSRIKPKILSTLDPKRPARSLQTEPDPKLWPDLCRDPSIAIE